MRTKTQQTVQHEDFTRKVSHFLQQYEANGSKYGMILSLCPQLGKDGLQEVTAHFRKEVSSYAADTEFFYDDAVGLLAVLIHDCPLSDTHYLSLALKDFLQSRGLLKSDMLISSLPECSPSPQNILAQISGLVSSGPGAAGGIRIMTDRSENRLAQPLLVVDNDETVCQFLKARLGLKGYEIHTARDGEEGLRLYEQLSPRLVVTELALPVLNGYQLIDQIQKKERNPDSCKIVVLTQKRLEDDISRCFERGVSDYVTKPFSPVELELRIRRLLA
ncbi:response regulator transcription factor [Brevibacillus sp. B_LB10_24]|uniref:response regulator transcription factor n=1 Tax=Brevibacillus sp. B_LB10_24 TaxID=3380645 RepID=UPI0038BC9108